jgi:hypothetical protein
MSGLRAREEVSGKYSYYDGPVSKMDWSIRIWLGRDFCLWHHVQIDFEACTFLYPMNDRASHRGKADHAHHLVIRSRIHGAFITYASSICYHHITVAKRDKLPYSTINMKSQCSSMLLCFLKSQVWFSAHKWRIITEVLVCLRKLCNYASTLL